MINTKQKKILEELFMQENIPRNLWYTKYSYNKIYDESRFKFSFLFQIAFSIMLLLSFSLIIRLVFFDAYDIHERLMLFLSIGAGCNALSESLGGNLNLGLKWFGITICFYLFV